MLRTLRVMAYVCLPLVTLLLPLLWTPTAYGDSPTIIYVDVGATGGTGDGSSWANAYTTLQDALDTTNDNGAAPYEIWVAEGVYYPDLGGSHVNNDPAEFFRINYNNVQIYGGFAATETLRTQRIPAVHPTVLSGDIDANDTNTDGNFIAETSADIQGSNAYHVLYLDGETNEPLTAATVLDGFIVTAGSTNTSGTDWDTTGGGLYCAADGFDTGCSPILTDVTFSGNYASRGGAGMFNNGAAGGVSSPVLTNVTFTGNNGDVGSGGGMSNYAANGTSSPVLTNVIFRNNVAYSGGAMSNYGFGGASSPVLTNVTFSGNTADGAGGAMFNYGGSGASNPTLTNVIFTGNNANYGGGMYNAGMYDRGSCSPVLTNVTFGGNRAFSGAGMYNNGSSNGSSSPQLVNVIMWGDSAYDGLEIYNESATPIITYSDIDQDSIEGTGNIRQDPQFKAPVDASSAPTSSGNYHIRPGSPAADSGTDNACPTTDLDGLTRPLDGSGDGIAFCDMGAYETEVLFVYADAAGTQDGKTWANAYTTIQDALDRTNAHGKSIFDIWVAEGVYYPDDGSHTNNDPAESFRINYDNVQIYGGFAATETLRNERIPAVRLTILSGDVDNDNGGADSNSDQNNVAETTADIVGSNAYHVLYFDGETNEAITNGTLLDGFIVTAGKASGSGADTYGGGLYCAGGGADNGCSPTVAHVTFSGNMASYGGGGMFNYGDAGGASSPLLTNVTFRGNQATAGAGMYNYGTNGTSSPVLANVTFSGNQASYGGGMYNDATDGGTSSPQLVNVIMWGDSAAEGSELYSKGNVTPAISYSDIDQDGITGEGNFRQDPKFVAPVIASSAPTGGGDYRLRPGSPAIDAGSYMNCPADDLAGTARPIDGDGDGGEICDMGAYETRRLGLYVDVDATTGAHDGSSWADAYQTLQDALDRTNTISATAFEIWVAEGVYYPDGGSHDTDGQSASFRINYNNVQIYGGFAGTETYRSQRDPAAHPTILSGDVDADSGGNDTNTDGNSVAETYTDIQGSNAYHVVYLDGETNEAITAATVLDGFIVTGGSASNENSGANGGGFYCAGLDTSQGCSPTIANVIVSGNMAISAGGGMYNSGSYGGVSSPALTNVTFRGNKADYGGGMFNNGRSGGVSSPALANVTFSSNQASYGGGMYNSGVSSPTLINVSFRGNAAGDSGGGMFNNGNTSGVSSPTLTNVTFTGNAAGDSGGGIYNSGVGGVSSPLLTNVTFSGNKASYGGAMYNGGDFGASSPQVVNVIMWGDSALMGAEIYNGSFTAEIAYSDIDQDGIAGAGNFRQDPMFVAPIAASSAPTTTGDYRIRAGSPAIDAGTNTGWPYSDLNGSNRPVDGNGDGNAICDVGAYETQLLFVDVDATEGWDDGSTWEDAYTTLQEALDWMNEHHATVFEIWVAEGVYYPDLGGSHIEDAQDESFRINYNNVQIYGGFAATETLRSERNPAVHPTILSGDIDANNGGGDTNNDSNSVAETRADIQGSNAYHVLYFDGETNEAITDASVLDGFIVTAGSANGSNADANGGGLFCAAYGAGKGCSPTLTHVTFSGNFASGYGGGMYNNGAGASISSPTLTNVTFRGNMAARGGGMYNSGDNGTGSPLLANVTFSGNVANDAGGGMANFGFYGGTNSPTLTNVTFNGNTANAGGGMYNYATGNSTSSPHLANVILWGDSAPTDAEIYNSGGTLDISYSDVEQSGIAGTGNFRHDPLLSSLGNYGGSMLTFALLPGSPAIDTGDAAACAASPVNNLDQRGVSRPQGSGCDIGAFESRGFTLTPNGGTPQSTDILSAFGAPLAVTAGSANAEPLGPGAVITLTPPTVGPGLSVTDPFTITTDAAGLAVSTIVTANGIVGSFNVTATAAGMAAPVVFSLTNTQGAPPQARADVAAVLQDTPLLIDVLANDILGTSPQLAVYTVTQPLAGGVTVIEQNQVRFTPTAGFTGLVTFTSTIQDGNGLADSAPVAVRVTGVNTTNGEPQVVSLPVPTSTGGGAVTVPAGTTEIEIPAGAISSAENPLATYDLVYQEVNTPEPPPPGTLFAFGGRAFALQLFIDAQLQTPYAFNVPIYVTVSYDPNVVMDTSKLVMYYYDESRQEWANDGIVIMSIDTQNHTFRASIAHLTEFAIGINAPTASDPNLEPQLLPQLFLPQIQP